LHTQPQQLPAIGCDAALEAAVAGEQIIDPRTFAGIPFYGERVAYQPGFDRGTQRISEAALVVVHPPGLDEVIKAANRSPSSGDPQQLYLASREAIFDQAPMKFLEES
jgi:hypothetical protein